MTGFISEELIGSYMDSIQAIPIEMQDKITNYLQSDVQHRHLLVLCKCLLRQIQESNNVNNKKKYLAQLMYFLVSIQGICDCRINDLDELNEIVEGHTQKLTNTWAKITPTVSQPSQSCTEKDLDNELNTNYQEECDVRVPEKASLIRRSIVQDFSTIKSVRDSMSNRNTEVITRGKDRFSARVVSNNNRANSRRALSRWAAGIHHRRKATNSVPSTSNHMLKQRSMTNLRAPHRAVLEQRQHKLGATYARYTRAQQQRLKNRVIPRSIQPGRARSRNAEFVVHGHSQRKRKTNMSKYINMDCKSSATVSNNKRRHERDRSGFYYPEDRYDLPIESIIGARSDDDDDDDNDRTNERDVLLELGSSRKVIQSPNWIKSTHDNDAIDDLDNSDSEYHSENECNHIGLLKTGFNHDQNIRISPLNAIRRDDMGNQGGMYRLRRTVNNSASLETTQYHRSNSVVTTNSDLSSSTRSHLPIHNSNCNYTGRRSYRNGGVSRFKTDTQQNRRSSPDNPSKVDDMTSVRNKVSRSPTRCPSDQTSEENASPDERLYCVCRKVSFGEMIACDNKCCEVEWFHFACVDVRVQPKGKWYCPYCRGESSKIKRCDL